MYTKKLIRGIISYIPVLKSIIPLIGTGGSNDAEYCLRIYSKHKDILITNGCVFPFGKIGEIGPGDSVGIGLCALVDGAVSYYGLDAIAHTNIHTNLQIFQELIDIYEIENIDIDDKIKEELLWDIQNMNMLKSKIKYYAPWWNKDNIVNDSLDVIISTAVMEHVLPLKETYKRIFEWIKPGGFCSHIIDYGAHEFSDYWYDHWYYSDFLWKILMHGRKYPISRMSHSYHMDCIEKAGFSIQTIIPSYQSNTADKDKISKTILNYFNDTDLRIKSAIVVAKKPS